MSDQVTITSADIERVAVKLEDGDALDDADEPVLRAVFYLAGLSASANEPEVAGFMPAYMKLGDIKGEAVSLNFTNQMLQGSLMGSFNQGASAHGAGGGGGAGKVSTHDISI